MSERILRGVGCPACGGSLEIVEGTILLKCGFCGTSLLVKGDRGIPRYYVPLKYTKEQILPKVQKWLSGFNKASDLKRQAKFADVFSVYVPFWRVRAKVVGWVLGDVEKGSGSNKTYKPVERHVLQNYEFTCPACDIGEFGVKWVDLQGDEILPFDLAEVQRQGMTFGVLTGANDVLRVCSEKFMEWAEKSARVDRVTFSKLHLINKTYDIVYYPLWVVRYEYKNRVYQVTADAESAEILYGRAPGNNLYRVTCLLTSILIGDFILTSSLRSGSTESDDFVGVLVISLIIMAFGFLKFRYGGEVKKEQKDKLEGNVFFRLFPEVSLESPYLRSIFKKR